MLSRPFTTDWEYCKNQNPKNLTKLKDFLGRVSKLDDGEIIDDPAPKKIKHVKTHNRKKRQNAKSQSQSSDQLFGANSSQTPSQDEQQRDDSNIAPKVAKTDCHSSSHQ